METATVRAAAAVPLAEPAAAADRVRCLPTGIDGWSIDILDGLPMACLPVSLIFPTRAMRTGQRMIWLLHAADEGNGNGEGGGGGAAGGTSGGGGSGPPPNGD